MIWRILFAGAFTFATSLAGGKIVLRILRAKLHASEEVFLGFVLGSACLSLTVFFLSAAALAYPAVFIGAGCTIIGVAILSGSMRFNESRAAPLPRAWSVVYFSLYTPFAVFYLLTALCPEASSDGAMYHVALPALYLRLHRIPALTSNMLAAFSEGAEMLYLFAFSIGRHSATAMVHLAFLLIAPWGILSYARRIGAAGAGVIGGLLFFLCPAVALDGTSAYVDIMLATVIFAVFYLLEIWRENHDDRLLIGAGILAGFSYGIKYTAGVTVIYVLAVIFSARARAPMQAARAGLMVVIPALALILPWMAKDAIVLGNPVAPFANQIFSNPYLYTSTEQDYARNMGSLGGMHVWQWPYDMAVRGARAQGFIGPMFLLAPLALLALRIPAGRRLLAATALFSVLGFAATGARFLFPALVFLSIALGLVLARWPSAAIAVLLLHAVSATPWVMPKYASRAGPRLKWPDWRAAFRLTPESDYLARNLEAYDLGRLMDARLAPADRVFSFQGFQQAYHSHEVLVEWQSALGVRLGESLRGAVDPLYQPTRRYTFSFAPVVARRIRLEQTSSKTVGRWSVSELRVFSNGRELTRGPAWRLRASHNPWDVQLAFDNSQLTRWSTRQTSTPGMSIEADLGESLPIDQVIIDCTPDQTVDMAIELASEGGQWKRIAANAAVTTVAMPPRLRRAAIENLERNNVRALAIHDLDPGARDLFMRQAQWGIELIGEAGRYRLYRLE